MTTPQPTLILGVDTHLDAHVAVAINTLGQVVGSLKFPAAREGYQSLLLWGRSLGQIGKAGVEGTGSYGADLARVLREAGIPVIEVNRPDRSRRRRRGKSDPTDAENAARAVLAGEARGVPKEQNGGVEAARVLSVARRSAVKARTQAGNQLRSLLVTAPEVIRQELPRGALAACARSCASLQISDGSALVQACKRALRSLAERWIALNAEIRELNAAMAQLIETIAPQLLGQFGVGPQTAASLLVAAGDNPERLGSESALAALCGVSPLEASSGKITRHRLNRGGNRQANNALWTIILVRARSETRTQAYIARRTREGRTLKEIFRCLKRYLVREIYPLLLQDLQQARASALT